MIYARSMKFVPSRRATRPTLATALALAGVAAAGVGCGEDEGRPIPASQARDLVGTRDHEIERAPQDLAALARRAGGPLAGGRGRRVNRVDPVVRPRRLE